MVTWRIWYINNLIVDGFTPEDWAAAPDEGVLAIAAHFGNDSYGRKLGGNWCGTDWYWMHNGLIYQNNDSLWEPNIWVPNPAPIGSVSKKGKWTTDENMEYVMSLMLEWIK